MKLLITGAFALTPEFQKKLEANGIDVTFHKDERARVIHPQEYDAVVCNGLFLYHPIEEFTGLKTVQLTSAGYDRMPMEYAREHGITVYNARGVYSVPMAEFALWGILQLYKQGSFFAENQKSHRWEKHRHLLELSGKRVCVVGCGSVGTEVAKRLRAFGCCVTGVDIAPYASEQYDQMLPLEGLDALLAQCDVVVLTLPLTDETRGLINKQRLACMKDGAVLVNIARGAVVEQAALIQALTSKRISAVLDVFEEEPLGEESPLWDLDNVILTPHNSFVGEGNRQRLERTIINNLRG